MIFRSKRGLSAPYILRESEKGRLVILRVIELAYLVLPGNSGGSLGTG